MFIYVCFGLRVIFLHSLSKQMAAFILSSYLCTYAGISRLYLFYSDQFYMFHIQCISYWHKIY
jgi:hypothetical protein